RPRSSGESSRRRGGERRPTRVWSLRFSRPRPAGPLARFPALRADAAEPAANPLPHARRARGDDPRAPADGRARHPAFICTGPRRALRVRAPGLRLQLPHLDLAGQAATESPTWAWALTS